MLGSEAAIRHPVLHCCGARLAESRLLTYQSEAVLSSLCPTRAAPRQRGAAQARGWSAGR